MRRFVIFLIVVLSFLTTSPLSAQNESTKWYFGSFAGLDFMTTPPSILANSSMSVTEGCSAISDSNGNLLFYTDGMTIWNQAHSIMSNGTNLSGYNPSTLDGTSSQGSIIVKQPGFNNIYYLFVVQASLGASGLTYNIIDMSLSAGMGSVTVKNAPLHPFASSEKIAATKHCNGNDIWIMTHDWNSTTFRAFLLSSTGVSSTSTLSSLGWFHGPPSAFMYGQMKFSPNGKKIAMSGRPAHIEIFDFDISAGVLSNSVTVNVPNAYGCEFSPDGTKIYVGGTRIASGDPLLYQFDICAGNSTAIAASQSTLFVSGMTQLGCLQLAPDGKIYASRNGQNSLGVINNPNSNTPVANYVQVGQSVAPNLTRTGLPNFPSQIFLQKPILSPYTYTINSIISC